MAAGKKGEINVDGMVLMARPRAWSEQARREDQARAGHAISIKQQAIRDGSALREVRPASDFMNSEHPSARKVSGVRRTMEALQVPESSRDHLKE